MNAMSGSALTKLLRVLSDLAWWMLLLLVDILMAESKILETSYGSRCVVVRT
jgi:hypothetical protein